MTALPVVLCLTDLTDTTGLNFNGQTITGLGPLSFEAQRGMSLHPSYAVSADREPLGLLDAWMWARKPKNANGQRRDINESLRWIESYERLTHREVNTSAQIDELIEGYRARWEIEMLFHVLKNGCRVEALQPATGQPGRDRARAHAVQGGVLAHCAADAAGPHPPRVAGLVELRSRRDTRCAGVDVRIQPPGIGVPPWRPTDVMLAPTEK